MTQKRKNYFGVGIALGAGVGTAVGSATGNIGVGVGVGIGLGIIWANYMNKKRIKNQEKKD